VLTLRRGGGEKLLATTAQAHPHLRTTRSTPKIYRSSARAADFDSSSTDERWMPARQGHPLRIEIQKSARG